MREDGMASRERFTDGGAARAYCRRTLPRVSRTFALNIRVLSGNLRDAVGQAYLFCRIADTVEDSPHLAPSAKAPLLESFAALFPVDAEAPSRAARWASAFEPWRTAGDEYALCHDAARVFAAFETLPAALRPPVEDCVREMALGMRDFARRRASDAAGRLQLEDTDDLERYCHVVAGTVGTMLVRLFEATSPHIEPARAERLSALAGRFGLALQLTNIIKDVATDVRRGACYVPRAWAKRHGIEPQAILDPAKREAARAVVRDLARHAVRALDAALAFTLELPRRELRLRLFCLWPLFLAVRTLSRVLPDEHMFVPGQRPRISRDEVRRCLGETTLAVWSNAAIRRLYGRRRLVLETMGY